MSRVRASDGLLVAPRISIVVVTLESRVLGLHSMPAAG